VRSLFSGLPFAGFGPSRFAPAGPPAAYHIASRRLSGLRARVREEGPRRPGIYGMLDDASDLIYVGKAKNLRNRLLSYFRAKGRDAKVSHMLEQVRAIAWEPAPSEFGALLRELELIRRWHPRFNVHGRAGRRLFRYVCLGRRPAPYVFLAPKPPTAAVASYGPVPAGRHALDAVRRVNDWFRLRDCPQSQEMIFADQAELFPVDRTAACLRHALSACLGPCAALCSHGAYLEQVKAARAFLEGADLSPLQTLETQMAEAAALLQFERASALRDKRELLLWLHEHLERLRQAQVQSFVYPLTGYGGQELWYLILRGRVIAVLPAPREADDRERTAAVIESTFPSRNEPDPLKTTEVDGVMLVLSWFRRHPEERARVLEPAAALALCRRQAFPSNLP
jgi:excinuclease ABC subunit C